MKGPSSWAPIPEGAISRDRHLFGLWLAIEFVWILRLHLLLRKERGGILLFRLLTGFALFGLFAFSLPSVAVDCRSLLQVPRSQSLSQDGFLFSQIEAMESALELIVLDANSHFSADMAQNDNLTLVLTQASALQERVQELTDRALEGDRVFRAELNLLRQDILNLGDQAEAPAVEMTVDEGELSEEALWSMLVEAPSTLESNRVYTVPSNNAFPIQVSFSEDIVKNFFSSTSQLDRMAAQKTLAALRKGYIGSHDKTSGIVNLTADKRVYEVRIRGTAVGAIRLGGSMRNGVLHFVHVSHSSNHGSAHYIHGFINAVLSHMH